MPKNCPLNKKDAHACWECLYSFGNSCVYNELKEETKEESANLQGEKYIGTAHTVQELINILNDEIPPIASIELASSYHCTSAEVWYDEDINTVVFK